MMRPSGPVRTYGTLAARCACLLLLGVGLMLSGCASGSLTRARDAFYSGDAARASEALADPENVGSRDRLLYYMEKGVILHHSGDYQGSADILLDASELIREQDIIRAGQQAASLVTSEWLMDYKGEYAERLLVHTYLMMNFLMLGNHESALVEAKQALEVYDTYPEACDGDYFTRALIAHCFEAVGEINGAYIEYKKLAGVMGDPGPVARKLVDLGNRLGFDDEVAHFRQFLSEPESGTQERPTGEAIVFLSRGRAPVKVPQNIVLPPSIRFSFVTYEDRGGYFPSPGVGPLAGLREADRVTTDVGAVLRTSLNQRLVQVIAKETARVAAKEAIAHNVKNDNLELLVRIAFFLMEVPDTRCWETLPGSLTLIRAPLFPGENPLPFNGPGKTITLPGADAPSDRRPFYQYYSIRQ
ncbi:MAG: hypothetical protein COX19_10400 [Desulfobacterales bacterium CG23_combo_of_CG06-09_8_20_14_all_51_8]|nr:MAG: hypothetical protein COX19_10400 [Desulfobacterales bacterium CG23_combo_of_CG06-09_8_20_14_all_51_8]